MLPLAVAVLISVLYSVHSSITINVTSLNVNGDICYVLAPNRLSIACFASQYTVGQSLALVCGNGTTVYQVAATTNSTEVDDPLILDWATENIDYRDELIRTTYSCKRFDKNGILLENSTTVRVRAFQCFSFPNESVTAIAQEQKELRCLSSVNYQVEAANVTYTWLLNGKILPNKTTSNITITVSKTTVGVYRCVTTFEDMFQQLWRTTEVYMIQLPCLSPQTYFLISNPRGTKTVGAGPASLTWDVSWYEVTKDSSFIQAKTDRISLRQRQAESNKWSVAINLIQPRFDLQAVAGSLHELEITIANQAGTCKPERRFIVIPG